MGYFERFVSRRYLFSRGSRWLVSLITFISVAGVTVGVAALIIVLGVIEGIDKEIFGKIVDVYPHLKISDRGEKGLKDPAKVVAALEGRKEIANLAPEIHKQVLFVRGSDQAETRAPGQLIGSSELGRGNLYNIPNSYDQSNISLGEKEVILGAPLAYQLHARPGDDLYAYTGMMTRTANDWHPRIRSLKVIGIFQTGIWDFDQVSAFVSTDTAREVFGLENSADYLHVKLKDAFGAHKMKTILEATLGPDYEIKTWEEENKEFFQALKMEKLGLLVILFLVVIVASFNIIGTLILLVIEKKREIGILKAIGSSDGMVRGTFLSAGWVIGIFGTLLGVGFGMAGAYAIKNYVRLPVPPSAYNFDRLPVIVHPTSVALIVASSMLICLLAALFPATQAARLNPVEALRHD